MDGFFSTLSYTHGFTVKSEVEDLGEDVELDEEDTGNLELVLGYYLMDRLALTGSIKTDLIEKAAISEDWIATLGVRYEF